MHSKTFRSSSQNVSASDPLGLLADLPGIWVGSDFILISLPDKHDNKTFRLKLNATREITEFTPICGLVPNRGVDRVSMKRYAHGVFQRAKPRTYFAERFGNFSAACGEVH
jgi:hypothetical protein